MKAKNIFLIAAVAVLAGGFSSCVKSNDPNSGDLQKQLNFDWNLTTTAAVSGTSAYDVVNQDGDTIASNITGNYNLAIAKGDVVTTSPTKASATKASGDSRIYFPTNKEYASYWVEDLFPFEGDMDFNDVVFGLRYTFIVNKGYVRQLMAEIYFKACGSTYKKLGAALKIDGSYDVTSNGGYFKGALSELFNVNSDYMEETSDVVVPLCGNVRKTFKGTHEDDEMINTYNDKPFYNAINQYTVKITLNSQVTYEQLYAALNPFVVIDERGKEIHLKGRSVTSKFDSSKYPTEFYDSKGFVWMMMIPKKLVAWPTEKTSIYDAYPQFVKWVFNEESSKTDWYMYPDASKTYKQNY